MPSKKRGKLSKREYQVKLSDTPGSYSAGHKVGMPKRMMNLKKLKSKGIITSLD